MIQLDGSDIAQAMRALNRSMNAGNSKAIKRIASKRLRLAAAPLAAEMKTRVLGLPSQGRSRGGSMRQAIARQTRVNTRWSGKNAGVSVVQRSRGMPRDFRMAGRMFNREEGWSPSNLAGETTHQEMTPANWFDGAAMGKRKDIQRHVVGALAEVADTMAQAAHRR